VHVTCNIDRRETQRERAEAQLDLDRPAALWGAERLREAEQVAVEPRGYLHVFGLLAEAVLPFSVAHGTPVAAPLELQWQSRVMKRWQ
jgi:hypothetical protein